jgi:hypothetical protein
MVLFSGHLEIQNCWLLSAGLYAVLDCGATTTHKFCIRGMYFFCGIILNIQIEIHQHMITDTTIAIFIFALLRFQGS